ncbi:unnamed protein product [Paramecium octaurelia]|uniref:Uncharacterized protein n=1 Tax=Paramecium octaurelia TaxID=43137 RepID=A0A8S1SD84_PAROT|nr:unnamed protein product [Paramecium octaurelia]
MRTEKLNYSELKIKEILLQNNISQYVGDDKEIRIISLGVFSLDILLNFNTGVYLDVLFVLKGSNHKRLLIILVWIDLLLQSLKLHRLLKFLKIYSKYKTAKIGQINKNF